MKKLINLMKKNISIITGFTTIIVVGIFFLGKPVFAQNTDLPTKYDPRELGLTTPVKTQTKDICWTYAVTSAMESYLAKNGQQYTFSENYYNYLIATNATGIEGENPYATVVSNGGGLNEGFAPEPALDSALDWSGPVNESDFTNSITGAQSIELWKNLLPQKHVQSVITLPEISLESPESENDIRIKNIKENVQRYGNAIQQNQMYVGYETNHASQNIPKNRVGSFNHVTTIVGWDDNYNKDHFVYKPSKNGAFIVKNSWGPNWGDQGYLYISYEDYQLRTTDINIITSIEDISNYYKKYKNAFFTAGSLVSLEPKKPRTLAVTYTRATDVAEKLSAVSIKTLSENTDYDIYVKSNGIPQKNLEGFTKVQTGTKYDIGTETIRLTKPVNLIGKEFSVAIVYHSSDSINKQWLPVSPIRSDIQETAKNYILNESNGSWSTETFRSFFISAFTEKQNKENVTGVSIAPKNSELFVNEQVTLTGKVTPQNISDSSVKYRSLQPKIASVDSTGKVTANQVGKAEIEVSSTLDSTIETTANITVKEQPTINKIEINQTNISLKEGEKITLSAKVLPENAQAKKILWSSQNPLVAKVDQNGNITGKQMGITTIYAKTENNTVTASCKVTVIAKDYTNSHSFILWATDMRDTTYSELHVEDSATENIYFQYGAGFLSGTKNNWMELHLTTSSGKKLEAQNYPEIFWGNSSDTEENKASAIIEYTVDGTTYSTTKPPIKELEGLRVSYPEKITSNLKLSVNLKLKLKNITKEDLQHEILPILLKKGYKLYSSPSEDIVANGVAPHFIDRYNIYINK